MDGVFVHLGPRLPKHLILNLENTSRKFPSISVILIVDVNCIVPKISGVFVFRFASSELAEEIQLKLSHPSDFRDNFWANSLIRFIALHQYISEHNREIIHIESDVILSEDFPFAKFENLPKRIAYPVVSPSQGIASILYLRDKISSNLLIEEIKNQISKNPATTDMLILGSLMRRYPEKIQILPSAPTNALEISLGSSLQTNLEYGTSHFGGIFDGADIGCFLAGHDPRNSKGKRHIRALIAGNYVNPRNLVFFYSRSRNFPEVSGVPTGRFLPLFNLHIHSKDLRFFRERSFEKILKNRIENSHLAETNELSLRAIAQVIKFASERRINLLARKLKINAVNRL